MTPDTTTSPDDTTNAARATRYGSGFFAVDIRAGFERTVRDATENALTCYREAAKARAAGDEREAYALIELAEQSLDVARDLLGRLESLG